MSFANPSALWILALSILLGFFSYFYTLRLQRKISSWIDIRLWSQIIPDYSKKIFIRKNLLLALGLIFLSLALARPQWGEREELIQSEGMDILFALDLSNSMLAEDTAPSRLNRAQSFIKKSLQNLADDRVGIIGFAGKAFLSVPLTTDFGYVSEMTDTLDPSTILSQGTNIGAAIATAMKAFERGAEDDHKTSRAIVLISDGEDFGADAEKAAQKLKDFGAGFFVFAVGSSEGAPIPIRNEAGVLQTYKKDRSEKTVLSRVNKSFLNKIAEAAGGSFFELVNPEDAAYRLIKELKGFSRSSKKDQRQVTKIDRYPYFLSVAIMLLFFHLFTGYRKLLVLLFALWINPVRAQTLDSYLNAKKALKEYKANQFEESAKDYETSRAGDGDNPILSFNEATALAKAKRNEDAIITFNEATKKALSQGDYETAAKSLYNEGITQAEQKNLKDSYDRLTKSIELSKISNQPELEKKAREALASLVSQQKQQSQENQQKKDSKEDQKSKNKSGTDGNSNDPNKKDGQENKSQQKKNPQGVEEGKRREFKSGTLSKDVAESIMNDLSDREKQLNQRRLKERRTREVPNDQDW